MRKLTKRPTAPAQQPSPLDVERLRQQLSELLSLVTSAQQPTGGALSGPSMGRSEIEGGIQARGGRPPGDPADLRTARVGLRIHSDLRRELDVAAREDGVLLSLWVEKALVRAINERRSARILDAIGRYLGSERRE